MSQPPNFDARSLLLAFSAGELSAAEERTLFEAAAQDQDLFDQLMEAESLRHALSFPGERQRATAVLQAWEQQAPFIPPAGTAGSRASTYAQLTQHRGRGSVDGSAAVGGLFGRHYLVAAPLLCGDYRDRILAGPAAGPPRRAGGSTGSLDPSPGACGNCGTVAGDPVHALPAAARERRAGSSDRAEVPVPVHRRLALGVGGLAGIVCVALDERRWGRQAGCSCRYPQLPDFVPIILVLLRPR